MREEPEEQVKNITFAQGLPDAALEEEYHEICYPEKSLQRELPDALYKALPELASYFRGSAHFFPSR